MTICKVAYQFNRSLPSNDIIGGRQLSAAPKSFVDCQFRGAPLGSGERARVDTYVVNQYIHSSYWHFSSAVTHRAV